MSLIDDTQLYIYWEEVNTNGSFMSFERRTSKYFNLVARVGTIASKNCILARRPLLDIRSMHAACVRKDLWESVCNYVENYFEMLIE